MIDYETMMTPCDDDQAKATNSSSSESESDSEGISLLMNSWGKYGSTGIAGVISLVFSQHKAYLALVKVKKRRTQFGSILSRMT